MCVCHTSLSVKYKSSVCVYMRDCIPVSFSNYIVEKVQTPTSKHSITLRPGQLRPTSNPDTSGVKADPGDNR